MSKDLIKDIMEVPKKIIESYHQIPALLEFQVGEKLTDEQKKQIEGLNEGFRYNFIVTREKQDIWDGCPKKEILEELKECKNYRLEIWQGNSEEELKKFKDSTW